MAIRVESIIRYPIKSCAGINVPETLIGPTGIVLDREYMVVNEDNVFVSQRTAKTGDIVSRGLPSMCLITPSFDDEFIVIRAPGMPELGLPLFYAIGEQFTARIWKSQCDVQEVSAAASDWVSAYLSRERPGRYRLVRMLDSCKRTASAGEALTLFTDGFPFLIASRESLDALNARMGGEPVGMDRFRPNIVIGGCPRPHYEDGMYRIKIGDVEFDGHWLCDRCPMPGIDQRTGKKDGRPLAAMASYRRMKPDSDKVQFGRNFNHLGNGHIKVGDEVELLGWTE